MNNTQRRELEKVIEESYEDILSAEKIKAEASRMLKNFMKNYIKSSGKDKKAYKDLKELSELYKKLILDINGLKKDILKAIDEIETLDSAKMEDYKAFKEDEEKRNSNLKSKKRSLFNTSGRMVVDKIKFLKNLEFEIQKEEKEISKKENTLMSLKETEDFNIRKENLKYLKLSYESEIKELKSKTESKNKELRSKILTVLCFLGIIFYLIIN